MRPEREGYWDAPVWKSQMRSTALARTGVSRSEYLEQERREHLDCTGQRDTAERQPEGINLVE